MTVLNRRAFCQLGAGALVAATALPLAATAAEESAPAKPARKRDIKKAIMWGTIGVKGSVEEKMKISRDAGFEGVEMMSHMDRDEVNKALAASGLACASVCGSHHWAKPLTDNNPAVRQTGLDALKHCLQDAKAWGATSILLVPGVCNKQIPYDVALTRAREEIGKAVPLAEELQVRIAIENVWNNMFLSPVEAAQFVDSFKSKWVGWHFDIGNIIHYGWPEHWIRALGSRISRLHIKEYSRKKSDKEGKWAGFNAAFLEGDNDWPAVMKALDDIGYTGWGIAEQGGGGSPEGLKDLATRMDKIFAS